MEEGIDSVDTGFRNCFFFRSGREKTTKQNINRLVIFVGNVNGRQRGEAADMLALQISSHLLNCFNLKRLHLDDNDSKLVAGNKKQ